MKIILKIKEGGHSLPVNKSQTRKDTFANTKVVAIIVKLREREGQRVDLGRSLKGHLLFIDGGWWISFP